MSGDLEAAQQRLVEALSRRQRQRRGDGPRRAEVEAEIARLADELGLDPEELDGLTTAHIDAFAAPRQLQGRFRIVRRARDVMPFYVGLLLVPMIYGLGAPPVAAGIAAVVVLGAIVHHRHRPRRFEIDALGRLDIRRVGHIDWAQVDEASFRLRYPWLTSDRGGIARAAGTTAEVRLRRAGGRTLRLAQGQLFQVRPGRRPVSLDRLGRYLRAQAMAAGLTVERPPGRKEGWRATRRPD